MFQVSMTMEISFILMINTGLKEAGEKFPSFVPAYSDLDGRIHADKLVQLVEFFARKGHGIIVNLNYGTTFTSAYDQIHQIVPKLSTIFDQYGLSKIERQIPIPGSKQTIKDTRKGYWIHVDAALGGSFLPYIKRYAEHNLINSDDKNPIIDIAFVNGQQKIMKYNDIPSLDFTKISLTFLNSCFWSQVSRCSLAMWCIYDQTPISTLSSQCTYVYWIYGFNTLWKQKCFISYYIMVSFSKKF